MLDANKKLDPVFQAIQSLLDSSASPVLVGIDGRCAAGKTTLAQAIAEKFHCGVIHADDFYLRKEQRSLSRLKEPGGNIDRERMLREVFGPLSSESVISYRPLDCSTLTYGEEKTVPIGNLLIIEGAYSLHPSFQDFYDLKIFVDISPIPQMMRIVQRNGADTADVFQFSWIPMEEKYLQQFNVKANADLIV